ncbi:hypothetical protein PHMEG_00028945 [Phytophthora megakarya]|uniref:Uncharacterized protein n=1 Tax=Phytophthora megakarya TaxID=4795 RepID=A0A225V4F0_9STRA|nr:hypothetical protein PHMEG_00028945 [Phytophthora megakarya]
MATTKLQFVKSPLLQLLENNSTIAETDAGKAGVISLASAHMRRIFSRSSDELLVDCSHKT